MQLGFQILGWALRLLKRNRFCRSVIVVKGLSNWFWNFWHLKQCKNRCVGLPAWEGVVPQMYQGGLSVEGERWGVSVCFTQPCSILCLLQVVGQSSGYFCLNWDHLHICVVGEWVVGVRGPTVRTRRIMDAVAGLQGPSEIPELPWSAKSCPGPCQTHQQQKAPSQTSWEEKVVTNPEQLSGASSQGV